MLVKLADFLSVGSLPKFTTKHVCEWCVSMCVEDLGESSGKMAVKYLHLNFLLRFILFNIGFFLIIKVKVFVFLNWCLKSSSCFKGISIQRLFNLVSSCPRALHARKCQISGTLINCACVKF